MISTNKDVFEAEMKSLAEALKQSGLMRQNYEEILYRESGPVIAGAKTQIALSTFGTIGATIASLIFREKLDYLF